MDAVRAELDGTSAQRQAGDIVRVARMALGWSQEELGRRCGYSASTVSRLESGRTPLRDVILLRTLANVLAVPVEVFGLTRSGYDRPTLVDPSQRLAPSKVVPVAAEQEDSVHRRELLSGLVGLAGMSVLPSRSGGRAGRTDTVASLRRRLREARANFDACRYGYVATAVPETVMTAHRLLDEVAPGRMRDQIAAAVADGYCLASFLADKLGDYGLAWIMADRARTHASASGNPTSLAASTREAAVATRRAGYLDDASLLLTATADTLPTVAPDSLAARGCLLLTAAYTEAQNGNGSTAMDLISDAGRVARHLPERWPPGAIFTPSQVAVYAVGVHNALGNFAQALATAQTISLASLPSVERKVKVCLDVARASMGHGDTARSFNVLRKVEYLAPEDARRPSVQYITRQLLEGPGPLPAGLIAFARRVLPS